MMMALIPHRDAVSKRLVFPPVDPAISKRKREQHLCDVRKSLVRLEGELPSGLVLLESDLPSDELASELASDDDYLGGTSLFLSPEQKRRLANSRLEAYKKKSARLAYMDGFLPKLRQASQLTFAASPADFNVETAPDVDVLKILHVCPRDFRVRFQASHHTYYIDGLQARGSVTGMIHAFSNPFDADMVVTRMVNGRNWPRAGYLKHDVSFTWMSGLHLLCPELLDLRPTLAR